MARIPAQVRRTELIEAALRVMERDGVGAATTRAIVAEAGMPLATFHYCFRSRDEMLGELISLVIGREVEAALGGMAGGGPAKLPSPGPARLAALLRQGLHGYLEHVEKNPGHELVLFELNHYALRTPELAELAVEQYRQYYGAAEQVLVAAAEAAGMRWKVDVAVLARLVIVFLDGATTTWLVDRDGDATRQAVESVVDLLVSRAESTRPTASSTRGR